MDDWITAQLKRLFQAKDKFIEHLLEEPVCPHWQCEERLRTASMEGHEPHCPKHGPPFGQHSGSELDLVAFRYELEGVCDHLTDACSQAEMRYYEQRDHLLQRLKKDQQKDPKFQQVLMRMEEALEQVLPRLEKL